MIEKENRAAVWFLNEEGRLAWFAFARGKDAPGIARRVLVMFKRPSLVLPYWWEPDATWTTIMPAAAAVAEPEVGGDGGERSLREGEVKRRRLVEEMGDVR